VQREADTMSSERLEVHLNNTYTSDYKLTSTAQIWDGKAMLNEWTTNDPRALVHQGIEAAEPNVFEQNRMKQAVEKAATLFQATKITIIGK